MRHNRRDLLCRMVVGALVIWGCTATMVSAEGWFRKHWNGFKRDYQRNNAWPEGFVPFDRSAVRNTFDQQIANGWRVQNTLDDHYFEEDSGRLTEAGQLKIRTILTESPPAYRMVFVVRSLDPAETARRVASVQESGDRLHPGQLTLVGESDIHPRTTPAQVVNSIDRNFIETMPAPRIPSSGAGGGGAPSAGVSGS